MPSTLIVAISTIDDVLPHPNADRLMLAQIGGWQCVVGRNDDGTPARKKGDLVVFVPPDSVMPRELADSIGVTKYLAEKKNKDGQTCLVVRAQKLRGELSAGVILDSPPDLHVKGDNVAHLFGITKYEAPVRHRGSSVSGGQPSQECPMFWKYSGPENYRHYAGKNVLVEGETVAVTEKVHGTNSRVGIVDGEWMAGSNRVQRKNPAEKTVVNRFEYVGPMATLSKPDADEIGIDIQGREPDGSFAAALDDPLDGDPLARALVAQKIRDGHEISLNNYAIDTTKTLAPDWWKDDRVGANTYWWPTTLPAVRSLIEELSAEHKQVILYGEIYGPSIFYPYGKKGGELGYVAFDLQVDGKYLDFIDFAALCQKHGVEVAPLLYWGAYSHAKMQEVVGGQTTFKGANHIREGVVIRPEKERTHRNIGRLLLKYVSDAYLEAKDKGKVEDATDE